MKVPILVPTINANDDIVRIVHLHVDSGATVSAGTAIADVETTKAVATVQAEHSGTITVACKVGEELAVGSPLGWIEGDGIEVAPAEIACPPAVAVRESSPRAPVESPTPRVLPSVPSPPDEPARFDLTRLSAAAKALATQRGIDPEAQLPRDLGLVTAARLATLLSAAGSNDQPSRPGTVRTRVPLTKRAEIDALRIGAGEHLRSALSVHFRGAAVRNFVERNTSHGLLPLIIHEASRLIADRPALRSYYNCGEIVTYEQVNVGVAIDVGHGLKVAVVRAADRLTPDEIAGRIAEMTVDEMENRLRVQDVTDGTFTVTDLSAFDVLHFQPLINGEQSAILGIGGDSTQPDHPMSFTMAFDHRVLSGKEVAEFLQVLRDRILSYAPSPAVTAPDEQSCDMCLIDLQSYYREFGRARYAVMSHYMRADGTTGLICHRCRSGVI